MARLGAKMGDGGERLLLISLDKKNELNEEGDGRCCLILYNIIIDGPQSPTMQNDSATTKFKFRGGGGKPST